MDSLTQIVLGAAVGEAVLGKKVGNRAALYGAIAGTIPDLDVAASLFTDTTKALLFHRGFTHSIVFSLLFAPLFGWLVSRYEKFRDFKSWSLLFFWAFVTHPLLDAHTTWGTQLFWPFDLRLAYKTIFVIDPLYTAPFLVFLVLAIRLKKENPKRRKYNLWGLGISSFYLLITVLLKCLAFSKFESALKEQGIVYSQLDTRPSPMNTILWSANVDCSEAYLLANYSFFDTQKISFQAYPKNHELLGELQNNPRVQRMVKISEGWYTIQEEEGSLYFNDLRFGTLSQTPGAQDFVFKYEMVQKQNGVVEFVEVPKDRKQGKKLLQDLWRRIWGI